MKHLLRCASYGDDVEEKYSFSKRITYFHVIKMFQHLELKRFRAARAWGALLRKLSNSKGAKYVHMVATFFCIFKKFPRCARLGAMLRKLSISKGAKYVHMVKQFFCPTSPPMHGWSSPGAYAYARLLTI